MLSGTQITFQYPGSPEPVFTDLSFSIDTTWRCGLVGRNGRGKTTLLRMLSGSLIPSKGSLDVPARAVLLRQPDPGAKRPTRDVIRDAVAPFRRWEHEMEKLLTNGNQADLDAYSEMLDRYMYEGGFTMDSEIAREWNALGLVDSLLERPFLSLSGGEQSRAMIAALFLVRNAYPLLDEPANHLDLEGRRVLADYLSKKKGFLIVSHDREVLDRCVDHIASINKSDVRVHQGTYSTWRAQMEREEETELRRNARIQHEVLSLKIAARNRRSWSDAKESGKTSAFDSGFISARAARQMKRARAIERRIEERLAEKGQLLQNRETIYPLQMEPLRNSPDILCRLDDVAVEFGGCRVLDKVSLILRKGDRLALIGPNGSGKTTLIRLITGELNPTAGKVTRPGFLILSQSRQHPEWRNGLLRSLLRSAAIEQTRFRTILGTLGVSGEVFDRPLESFSQGQLKKVELARTLAAPAHLYLWDEATNALDLYARQELERVLVRVEPTVLFVDHDATFVRNAATRVARLASDGCAWTLVEDPTDHR